MKREGGMGHGLVPIELKKILRSQHYTVFILGTREKQFAIYAAPEVGRHLHVHSKRGVGAQTRPQTHELFASILQGLDIHLLQVVICDVDDTVYFARLFLEQQGEGLRKIVEVDARPSDCLPLALAQQTPLYCTAAALAKTVGVEG